MLSSMFANSSVEDITIGKFDFVIIKKSYDIYESKGELMQLYREKRNRNLLFALRLTLKDKTGDCASKGLQEGAYEIDNKGITLYSLWHRRGKAYLEPFGARIQHYEIQSDGNLKQVSSVVYIESARKKHAIDEGMEYLFVAPKNDEEKKKLESYVKEIERVYKAKFVYGEEKERLIKKVKKALKMKMKKRWSKK
jgi:hypothetical protein